MGDEVSSVNAEKFGRTLLSVKLVVILVKFSNAVGFGSGPRWLEMVLMVKTPVLTLTCCVGLIDAKISSDPPPETT